MRKTFFAMLCTMISACLISCNDDAGPAGEIVLSKTYFDGVLETEYVYENRRLAVTRSYNISTGDLQGYTAFEYDSRGFLESSTYFNATGEPTSKRVYLKNGDGSFTQEDVIKLSGANAGEVTTRFRYEYNKAGYISKRSRHDPETDKEESYSTFFYYENGNRERYERYSTVSAIAEKELEVRYAATARVLPESISKRSGYPINFELDLLATEQIVYEFFDTGQGPAWEYHEVVSGRTLDEKGFITGQTITYKYITPESPDEVFVRKYEYEEI